MGTVAIGTEVVGGGAALALVLAPDYCSALRPTTTAAMATALTPIQRMATAAGATSGGASFLTAMVTEFGDAYAFVIDRGELVSSFAARDAAGSAVAVAQPPQNKCIALPLPARSSRKGAFCHRPQRPTALRAAPAYHCPHYASGANMRSSGAFVLAIVIGVLLMPSPAPAVWCADYSLGTTNCGFPSFQACRAAVSGVGGMCTQAPESAEPRRRSRPSR